MAKEIGKIRIPEFLGKALVLTAAVLSTVNCGGDGGNPVSDGAVRAAEEGDSRQDAAASEVSSSDRGGVDIGVDAAPSAIDGQVGAVDVLATGTLDVGRGIDLPGPDTDGDGALGDAAATAFSLSIAPGAAAGTATVHVSLANTAANVAAVAVSVSPDNATASANAASVTVSGLTAKTSHTFTVTTTDSSGRSVVSTTNALAFYDVVETFAEPVCDQSTTFKGAYTFDLLGGSVTNLAGTLLDGMEGNEVPLLYQLSAEPKTLGGIKGQLVASFALPTVSSFTGGIWYPGAGTKTDGNENAYALIFVPADDPVLPLTQEQIDWLAYADCTDEGLMGKTCMTGTTIAGYGRIGTMRGYPISQVTTLR